MSIQKVSTAEAIEMFALARSYVRHEKYDVAATAESMVVKEPFPGVFYFWHKEDGHRCDLRMEPDATLIIGSRGKRWQVLMEGDVFTFVDAGSVWIPITANRKVSTRNAQRCESNN